MTTTSPRGEVGEETPRLSLSPAGARTLATTTKTPPQMQAISSRWLLRKLPWVEVSGGTYRINRRRVRTARPRRLGFVWTADGARVVPESLCGLPALHGLDATAEGRELLAELADRFVLREVDSGEVVIEEGSPVTGMLAVVRGRLERLGTGRYGSTALLGVLTDGGHLGDEALTSGTDDAPVWNQTLRAATSATVLTLPTRAFQRLREASPSSRTPSPTTTRPRTRSSCRSPRRS